MHSIMQRYSTICAPHACITAKACCSNATTTAATNISLQQPRNHLLKNTVLRNSCINATLHAAESLCHRIPVRSSSLGNRNISLALWAIVEAVRVGSIPPLTPHFSQIPWICGGQAGMLPLQPLLEVKAVKEAVTVSSAQVQTRPPPCRHLRRTCT